MGLLRRRSRRPDPRAAALAGAFGAGRVALGASFWLVPRQVIAALGFGDPDARLIAVSRIAGIRDIVLGAWQLSAREDDAELRRAALATAVADGGDALAFALALRRGETAAGLRGLAAAAPAAVAGLWMATHDG